MLEQLENVNYLSLNDRPNMNSLIISEDSGGIQ